ncbi:MAG: MBL fold metallo-hydrolase [Oscillospiraceae bacterium]
MKDGRVTLLGVRGTSPVCGANYVKYGGASSAVQVRLGGKIIVLDAGSGLLNLKLEPDEKELYILISHSHLDHICGIPPQPIFYDKTYNISLYSKERGGLDTKAQIHTVMAKNLWPVDENAFNANVKYCDISDGDFYIGDVKVRHIEGNHPGGCTIFRLEYKGKSVVFATDIEQTEESSRELIEFAKGCELLIIDGQYSAEKAAKLRGFGHMSREAAAQIGKACKAAHTVLTHHDTCAGDDELLRAENDIKAKFSHCSLAHCGEEFTL